MTPKVGDLVFLDTNILLTATDESRPGHQSARRFVSKSGQKGLHLVMSGQIMREYLVVATRPLHVNGLGLVAKEAMSNVRVFRRYIACFEETTASTTKLLDICEALQLHGKRIHDANLVAIMLTHGIQFLATDNLNDFSSIASFADISLLALADLAMIAP